MDFVNNIQNSKNSEDLGNSKPNPKSRHRSVAFTWNNYSKEKVDELIKLMKFKSYKYIFGYEVGKSGTKHVQGYIHFGKGQLLWPAIIKMLPKCHIEKAKGNAQQNRVYCSKDGVFDTNIELKLSKQEKLVEAKKRLKRSILDNEYSGDDVKWKPWQQRIINIMKEKADPRKVHWVWERLGNVGKSYLCKYLCLKHKCVLGTGKRDDVFNLILNYFNDNLEYPEVVILDIPRSSVDYINYGAIEQIKNGCFYSGKYEGGMCIFPIPRIIIFANEEPSYSLMSPDRWEVIGL